MAETTTLEGPLDELDLFVGEWIMTTSLFPNPADAPRARTSLRAAQRKRCLVQRWEVEHPDSPDGVAIIGLDTDGTGYLSTISTRVGSHACMR